MKKSELRQLIRHKLIEQKNKNPKKIVNEDFVERFIDYIANIIKRTQDKETKKKLKKLYSENPKFAKELEQQVTSLKQSIDMINKV